MDKMIFFDVDGTLVDSRNHEICDSTMKALKQLKKNGFLIGISTGRGYDSFMNSGVQYLFEWDGFVCNNGQIVLDKNHQILFKKTINEKTVRQIIDLSEKEGLALIIKTNDRFLTKPANEYVKICHKVLNNKIPRVDTYRGEEVDAITIYAPIDYDYSEFMKIPDISILPGNYPFADIVVADVSKSTGIDVLLKYYNKSGYIAFGDSMNDAQMFKTADLSIAMGQGNDLLKDMADYVTNSIYEDGIYNACIHLGLFNNENV